MLTLTVTQSRGSFGSFHIMSFGCCGISAAAWASTVWLRRSAGATELVQWLERGSMNAAQMECNCVNANIGIARRWLSKLGYAWILRHLAFLFKNSSDQYMLGSNLLDEHKLEGQWAALAQGFKLPKLEKYSLVSGLSINFFLGFSDAKMGRN